MLTRTEVLKTIKNLPERFSVEDLMDKIILLQKIEIGLEQSRTGKTLSTKSAKMQLEKWLK
jgi:hypothetical protein